MSLQNRTQTITGKVTPTEEEAIKRFCSDRNSDVSRMTREVWLEKLERPSPELSTTVYLIELAEKILEALVEANGKEYVARFRTSFEQNAAALIGARLNRIERR